MVAGYFRPTIHPGQAETLVHFCGRGRNTISTEVRHLSPRERLDSILQDRKIRAFYSHGSGRPVISFSESGIGGVEALIRATGWAPWGLVFTREFVWDRGGGPVWYVRHDHYDTVTNALPEFKPWLVRTEPYNSEWLHEREWRLLDFPDDIIAPGVHIDDGGLLAILVGDRDWEPSPVHTIDMNPLKGDLGEVLITPRHTVVNRWYWTGQNIEVLKPVTMRYDPAP